MMVKVHTDNHIVGKQDVLDQVEAMVRQSFTGFEEQLTRCEVYLSDVNGPKSTGDDIRCVIEVHPAGGHSLAATQNAAGLFEAVDAACETMHRQLADRTAATMVVLAVGWTTLAAVVPPAVRSPRPRSPLRRQPAPT